jgi:hypothetical protein
MLLSVAIWRLAIAGVFFAGIPSALAADELCRNNEKCFGLGVNVTTKPDLQYAVGSWPLPKSAKMRAAVGDKLHFEWDSRNEYYAEGQKNWVKRDTGLATSWEMGDKGGSPKDKDPCTGEEPGPWKAKTRTGVFDEVLKDCALGHTFRIHIHSDKIKPKFPEATLEITVVKGPDPAPLPTDSE